MFFKPLWHSEESSGNKSTYIIEEEIANVETTKKRWVAPILMKTKSIKHAVKCQIDSGASCSVISHSLVCKLLQDGNSKLQESKQKLQMYNGSVIISYGVIDIKCEVNQAKTKLQFQVVDTKKDPLISASGSLALSLIALNNDQVNDEIHGIKITKRKTNGGLLSKKKILEEYGDVFDTIGCLPGELHLEVDKSIRSVQHVPRKIAVAIKEEIMKKIDKSIDLKIVAKVNEPTDWISSMIVVKKPIRICIYLRDFIHSQQLKIFYRSYQKQKCFQCLMKKMDFDKKN